MKTTHSKWIHYPLAWLAVAMLGFSGTLPAQVIPGRYIAVLKAETRDTPGAAKALAAQNAKGPGRSNPGLTGEVAFPGRGQANWNHDRSCNSQMP